MNHRVNGRDKRTRRHFYHPLINTLNHTHTVSLFLSEKIKTTKKRRKKKLKSVTQRLELVPELRPNNNKYRQFEIVNVYVRK